MSLNENVRTTITVRGKKLRLKRGWLHGLWSWEVYLFGHSEKLGWVLQEFDGRKWAAVHVPEKEEDEYDQIWYEYDSRHDAIFFGLLGDNNPTSQKVT